jgi:hypothetical protein
MACIIYLSLSIYIQMANLATDGTGAERRGYGDASLRELRASLGGCDHVDWEMYLEATIERV